MKFSEVFPLPLLFGMLMLNIGLVLIGANLFVILLYDIMLVILRSYSYKRGIK